jgi:hypothetical protein
MVLLEALATLPPRQRAVVVLRYWEDHSVEDAAALLGCSVGTVKSQSARGLAALRTRFGTPAPEPEAEAQPETETDTEVKTEIEAEIDVETEPADSTPSTDTVRQGQG